MTPIWTHFAPPTGKDPTLRNYFLTHHRWRR